MANHPSEEPTAEDSESRDEGASKASTPAPSKTKRRGRLVHAAHEALGACDTCRLRRIKCIRSNPVDPTCESCAKRQTKCTQLRNGGLRYKPRSGKRIDAAAAAFGTKTAVALSASNESFRRITMIPNESAVARVPFDPPVMTHLSEHSTEHVLAAMELSESTLAGLVDQYFSLATFSVPLAAWSNLQMRFERAGRRMQQLDIMTEVSISGGTAEMTNADS